MVCTLRRLIRPSFARSPPPSHPELLSLVQRIAERVGRHLERRGVLVREEKGTHLAVEGGPEKDALPDLQGHSILYRIAAGPHRGRKAFTWQTLAPRAGSERERERGAQAHGFSLHAGVAAPEPNGAGEHPLPCRRSPRLPRYSKAPVSIAFVSSELCVQRLRRWVQRRGILAPDLVSPMPPPP